MKILAEELEFVIGVDTPQAFAQRRRAEQDRRCDCER